MFRMMMGELLKIRTQKRNYVILAGHLLFVLLFWYLSTRSRAERSLLSRFEKFSDFGVANALDMLDGLFLARLILVPTFMLIMPIAVCTLAGDMIAGEAQDGSLKLYLARSRSRSGVYGAKLLATYVVNLLYSLYFASFGLLVGVVVMGVSKLQLVFLVDDIIGSRLMLTTVPDALLRYYGCVVYFSFSLMALGCLALCLSAIFERMTTATIAALTLHFVCYAVNALPFADPLRPYLLVNMINNASVLWMVEIPWMHFFINLAGLSAYIIGFSGLGLMIFNSKDIR